MKKSIFMAVVGLVCVALMGCGGQESSTGGTQGSEQSAEEFLEQLDEEYQEMVEAEEEQHEAELEAEYPEGILPAGKYRVPNGTSLDLQIFGWLYGFDAQYDSETGEGEIYHPESSGIKTVTDVSWGGNADSYRYDPETGLYHFELYCINTHEGIYIKFGIFEGYYNAEDDSFTVTYYDDLEKNITSEDGYEQVYYRE